MASSAWSSIDGYAYQAGGAVYFDVSTWPTLRLDLGLRRGHDARARRASAAATPTIPNKRNPLDFVLWQPSADDEPAWESLWGPGRPGWHIECSALALRELGTTIDLHGGGADLIFPHHECEAAQSEAATGEPFVRHWMHQAMVRMDGHEDVEVAREPGVRQRAAQDLRPPGHSAGRRSPTTTAPSGSGTTTSCPRPGPARTVARRTVAGDGALDEVRAALDDDLDTPAAVPAIDAAADGARVCRRAAAAARRSHRLILPAGTGQDHR